jgi:L-lactate dehydrogenase complex protein LldG
VVEVEEMTARDEILGRIERALGDAREEVEVPRAYRREEPVDAVERFVERVSDYKATVLRVRAEEIREAVAERCRARGAVRLAVPDDLPDEWAPEGIELARDGDVDTPDLDRIDGALTGCALAIGETGTIVLDSGRLQGRRALTLVPDYHICVVREDQVVGGIPEAMARIAETLRATRRPVTFVSGPSATSDIELSRVEGVHGPRTLEVLVAAAR